MADSQVLTVIRMWASVAWADGVLAEAEADGLRRLIRTAELSEEDRTTAMTYLDAAVDFGDDHLEGLSVEARRGIYRASCRLAIVDRVFAKAERDMLDRLRVALAIPQEAADEIEHDVPGFVP